MYYFVGVIVVIFDFERNAAPPRRPFPIVDVNFHLLDKWHGDTLNKNVCAFFGGARDYLPLRAQSCVCIVGPRRKFNIWV